jgi:hypothetical protein
MNSEPQDLPTRVKPLQIFFVLLIPPYRERGVEAWKVPSLSVT